MADRNPSLSFASLGLSRSTWYLPREEARYLGVDNEGSRYLILSSRSSHRYVGRASSTRFGYKSCRGLKTVDIGGCVAAPVFSHDSNFPKAPPNYTNTTSAPDSLNG